MTCVARGTEVSFSKHLELWKRTTACAIGYDRFVKTPNDEPGTLNHKNARMGGILISSFRVHSSPRSEFFMNFRMSPKRWFWLLLGVALLWSGLGNHWREADASVPSPMRRFQSAIAQPFLFLLVPAQFVFTGIEGVAATAIERVTMRHDGAVSVEALQEQLPGSAGAKARRPLSCLPTPANG